MYAQKDFHKQTYEYMNKVVHFLHVYITSSMLVVIVEINKEMYGTPKVCQNSSLTIVAICYGINYWYHAIQKPKCPLKVKLLNFQSC